MGAVEAFAKSLQGTSTAEFIKDAIERLALGFTAPQIVGSYETCAEQLRELNDAGLESTLLCFYDPQKGLHQMQDDVIPILRKMGLRK
jgi:alkanesulfonate monooxygenase SsuD/methylene tetrahydromethanopterin reductase-like flavin-dependent oxidoreductase (luciferase family)